MSATINPDWSGESREGASASSLRLNAFLYLGATTRDDRRKIVELAECKALEVDGDGPQKARAALTNPRARLAQEIAWLPGVAPNKALDLLQATESEGLSISGRQGIPKLALANLTAAAFESWDEPDSVMLSSYTKELGVMADEFDVEEVIRDINEDRAVSGFPPVADRGAVESELAARRSAYLVSVKDALDRMQSSELVDAMVMLVKGASLNEPAPTLVDQLVDAYALEVEPILSVRAESILAEVERAKALAPEGKFKVGVAIDGIGELARAWCSLAKPIQLSAAARGTAEQSSLAVGGAIRSLGLALNNEHNYFELAQRTTAMIAELFSELPELAEVASRDAEKLEKIQRDAEESKRSSAEWEEAITFRAEVGLLFKDKLAIGPDGIEWAGSTYPLADITAIRWGGVRNSINGIPTGTNYKIGVATRAGSFVIELKKEATYSRFVDCLWRAVGGRLVVEMLEALKAGRSLSFGTISIDDSHIHMVRTKLFGPNQTVSMDWRSVKIWSANGSVFIGSDSDKKLVASSSYINDWNTHVLEQVVRGAFKKGVRCLSDFLS